MNATAAACAQTHCAILFFVGDRVLKLKRPVNLGFLDFTTREARLRACRREVELNRRLAPDVYLGVLDIVGEDGKPCDHLVAMRRMPAETRLSTLVRSGAPVRTDLRRLARLLAAFHATARTNPQIAAAGSREALRGRWESNFEPTRPLWGSVLDTEQAAEVERLALRYLAGREPLFAARAAAGLVRDGHGDLIADDIFCLPDGPRALDCLEFDDQLRWVDGLDDAAFLTMDLERLGMPELGEAFLEDYLEFAGTPRVVSLEHHYVAYRAFVRAKVACIRHLQGDPEARSAAVQHTAITLRHLRAGTVRLLLVGGPPGSGKSTVAAGLADQLGAVLLRSDRVRKELAALPPSQSAAAPYLAGLYSPEWTDKVYGELCERAAVLLGRGESVVLDATWTGAMHRQRARLVATATSSDLVELSCRVPGELAAARLSHRPQAEGPASTRPAPDGTPVADAEPVPDAAEPISDAGPAVGAALREAADPWPEATELDTSTDPAAAVRAALAAVGGSSAG